MTSADVRCATASCRVGSKGRPSRRTRSARTCQRRGELLGHRGERADQVAVLAGPVEVVQHRQQRAEHRAGGLLGRPPPGRGRPACGSWRTRPSTRCRSGSARRARCAAPPARRRAPAAPRRSRAVGVRAGARPARRLAGLGASRSAGSGACPGAGRRRRLGLPASSGCAVRVDLAPVPDHDLLAGRLGGPRSSRPSASSDALAAVLRRRVLASLLVVLVDDLGVHDVVAAAGRTGPPRRPHRHRAGACGAGPARLASPAWPAA